ncbi:hypothetical protein Cflav_PD3837 [Pedosphaera parvula Ellin514]|uniref:Uncharacterized protein n=1 Tax=Pedosphaera parvula (strain Ellin514) TaxID=320771 RepID=B9XFV8_PEDPL|nr:hypothetical protein Cflav_PD3837 [Pedosphaera parvula Ellin514]
MPESVKQDKTFSFMLTDIKGRAITASFILNSE